MHASNTFEFDIDAEETTGIVKPDRETGRQPKWYRPKLTREQLSTLNRKSDIKGAAQTLGFLATLTGTGALFVFSCFRHPWAAPFALLLHGGCMAFLVNGFHELVHQSVFRTRWLNDAFVRLFSFLGWYSHVHFWASHTEHHKFTLHPPDDLEVVLPQQVALSQILKIAFFDFNSLRWTLKDTVQRALGYPMAGEWNHHLFDELNPGLRFALRRWAWVLLAGHAFIGIAAIATGWWPVWIAISFGRFFGNGVQFLCNASQHIGLVDRYPDFRLCCRTIYLSPLLQFLYWHMNYHTEHHMYAGVPCYNLGRLHRMIRHEMPPSPRGLVQTWRQISAILKRQKADPTFQYVAPVPNAVLSPLVSG